MPVSVTFSGSITPTVTNAGRTVVFDLGDVTNIDTDNTIAETIHITYTGGRAQYGDQRPRRYARE